MLQHADTGIVRAIMGMIIRDPMCCRQIMPFLTIIYIDGTYLTGLRTAAGSAIATDLFTSTSAKKLVVWGWSSIGVAYQVHNERSTRD